MNENQFFRLTGATSLFAEIMHDNNTLDSDEQVGMWVSILIEYGFNVEAIISIIELIDDTYYRLTPLIASFGITIEDIIAKLDAFKLDS